METPLKIGFQGSDPSEALSHTITDHVDALERHLDRMDQSTPTKEKTRRKR